MGTTTAVRAAEKTVLGVHEGGEAHWVGDGFPVRSLLSYRGQGADDLSPFLLLDYAGPFEVAPSEVVRGVGEHPHKGFETVTIAYQGEVAHRDSSGGEGTVGPGDVQWMTAGAGVVHEEVYSREFARRGGALEFVQLWVNLPARHKGAPAGYQTLSRADIPTVDLGGGATARVIAGELAGVRGPARTFTPVNVWDVRLPAGARVTLPVPDGHNAALVVLRGAARLGDGDSATSLRSASSALLSRAGGGVTVEASEDAVLLLLSGEPIDEPIAAYGPFVMNTKEEITEALSEYKTGKMGRLE